MSNVVVVEDKLEAIFNLIPESTFEVSPGVTQVRKKPNYYYGDAKECNALIKQKGGAIYPLIFQISTNEDQNPDAVSVTTDLELVICTQNLNEEMNNKTRWATSYKNVLIPLLNDVYKALSESGIVVWDGDYQIDKLPNYSETPSKDKNSFIDTVDAILFKATLTIRGKGCINKTIFNK